MKTLKVLLVVTCFSSFVYADNFFYLTDAQKRESLINYRENKISTCISDNTSKVEDVDYDYARVYREARFATDVCKCAMNTAIEKAGGKDIIENNDADTIKQRLSDIIDDKNQMTPIMEQCTPEKTEATY